MHGWEESFLETFFSIKKNGIRRKLKNKVSYKTPTSMEFYAYSRTKSYSLVALRPRNGSLAKTLLNHLKHFYRTFNYIILNMLLDVEVGAEVFFWKIRLYRTKNKLDTKIWKLLLFLLILTFWVTWHHVIINGY